jgi:hypothetical protein
MELIQAQDAALTIAFHIGQPIWQGELSQAVINGWYPSNVNRLKLRGSDVNESKLKVFGNLSND